MSILSCQPDPPPQQPSHEEELRMMSRVRFMERVWIVLSAAFVECGTPAPIASRKKNQHNVQIRYHFRFASALDVVPDRRCHTSAIAQGTIG